MLRLTPYILKTLWRHRSRTLLTLSGSAVALFVFCFVGAVQEGFTDLRRRQDAQGALVVFQANKFCPATSHLPQDYERQIALIECVRDVVPIQVFTNNCRASLDVVVFYGLPRDKVRQIRPFELLDGKWTDFEQDQDAAIVGSAVARRRSLNVGDSFTIGGVTVTVAGIFSCDDLAEENCVYTGLDFLQRRSSRNRVGTVTQFEVFVTENSGSATLGQSQTQTRLANLLTVSKQIDEIFWTAAVPTATRSKGAFQAKALGDLTQIIRMANYLGYACVGLVLVLVATTTVMSVQDRVKEHAVLQTIGFSSPRIFCLVLEESVLLSLAGGAIGTIVAIVFLKFTGLAIGAEGVMMAFRPSAQLAAHAITVALLSGLLAGILPAWQAARTEIVPALRQG